MKGDTFFDRITVDPDIMVGKPIIRGMRITVEQILKALAGGLAPADLLEDYPELEEEDIKAALLGIQAMLRTLQWTASPRSGVRLHYSRHMTFVA
jgi:uncharacterized protein (DUF433 family)